MKSLFKIVNGEPLSITIEEFKMSAVETATGGKSVYDFVNALRRHQVDERKLKDST